MRLRLWTLTILLAISTLVTKPLAADDENIFAKPNLVAWCVVPFDAAQRGPEARAKMLKKLGIGRLAYDWRAKHVETFEEEIVQMKKHGIDFFAFWSFHPAIEPLIRKHKISPQIWKTLPSSPGNTQEEKVEAAAKALMPLVEKTRSLGCKFGLYNHGGWGGEPENMVAVVKWLRANAKADHVGIVYNLHHGHDQIADFAQVLNQMKPYLLCLNLNGMNDNAQPKILTLGAGRHDLALLEIIAKSGYTGPIGILDHRSDTDTQETLQQNLAGLAKLVEQMKGE